MKKILALVAVFALVAFATPVFAAANPFMDVPMNHWAYDAIGQLAARGVLSGYPNGAYKGNQPMTRYEVASAVARALAVVDMTKASKQDVEMLKKLVVEFKDELDALGVKVDQLDSRVAVLEEGVGGWKIAGSFRMDWKWADRSRTAADTGTYTDNFDQQAKVRKASNWLQFTKRVDDKVSFTARLRRTPTGGGGMEWSDQYIKVKFPWDFTGTFGRSHAFLWEDGLYEGLLTDESWFLDTRIVGMMFDKPFGMGQLSFFWAHEEDDGTPATQTSASKEATFYGARVRFNFNEQFNLGLHAVVRDYETNDLNGNLSKFAAFWADFGFYFTPDVALKGMWAFNKYDVVNPAILDDSPNAYKLVLDVNQNALKFTSLWIEYAKLDNFFATHNNALRYTEQANGDDSNGPAFGMDDPTRTGEMKYWMIAARQKWNDRFSTFFRYLDVSYDAGSMSGGTANIDHKNWLFGMSYNYTPALQFQLLYDAIDFDNTRPDDHMIRFRTTVSF